MALMVVVVKGDGGDDGDGMTLMVVILVAMAWR